LHATCYSGSSWLFDWHPVEFESSRLTRGGTESRNLAIIIFRHEKLNLTMQRTLFKMNESQMQAFKILAQVIWGNQLETEAVFSKLKIQFTLMNRLLDQLDEMIQQEMKTFHLTDADLPFEPDAGR